MSAWIALALVLLAWFFIQSGATFFGFFTLIIAVLYAVGTMAAPPTPVPTVPSVAAPQVTPLAPYPTQPLEIRHRIQPSWIGPLSGEDRIGRRIGGLLSFIAWNVRGIIDVIRGAPPKSEAPK